MPTHLSHRDMMDDVCVETKSRPRGAVCFRSVVVDGADDVASLIARGFGATSAAHACAPLGETPQASLVLLDEEALYLALSDALEVTNPATHLPMDAPSLWAMFCGKLPSFPAKYRVYSYFKEKGYMIRTGINFGMDYCLYRDLPSLCHSEMCVQVVDAVSPSAPHTAPPQRETFYRKPAALSGIVSEGSLTWRHVSSLTRVTPDVMKTCLLCFVVAPGEPEETIAEQSPYLRLFNTSSSSPAGAPSWEDARRWDVRPVAVLVRRQQVNNDRYPSVQDVARRYQLSAKLRHARRAKAAPGPVGPPAGVEVQGKRKRPAKKRRDAAEVRTKGQSKSNALWSLLLAGTAPPADPAADPAEA